MQMTRSITQVVAGLVLAASFAASAGAGTEFQDMPIISATINHVLETQKNNVSVTWSNPETGNSGDVVAERTYYLDPRTPCRDYRRTSKDSGGGPTQVVLGTGCRTSDGNWRLNERSDAETIPSDTGSEPAPASRAATGAPDKVAERSPETSKPPETTKWGPPDEPIDLLPPTISDTSARAGPAREGPAPGMPTPGGKGDETAKSSKDAATPAKKSKAHSPASLPGPAKAAKAAKPPSSVKPSNPEPRRLTVSIPNKSDG